MNYSINMDNKTFQYHELLGLIGLLGSILIIISEFLPWFSSTTLFGFYFITIDIKIENAFLYLFPLMSGLICLSGNILIIIDDSHRTKFAILDLFGLSFILIFLLQIIPIHSFSFLFNYSGIYVFMSGLILIILNLIDELII
jgi:hypothetical protein